VAGEDELDGDDDTVDIEQEATDEVLENVVNTEEEDGIPVLGKSPDGETNILFIKPKPGLIGNSGAAGKSIFPVLHCRRVGFDSDYIYVPMDFCSSVE
jgi:hypothetical protein